MSSLTASFSEKNRMTIDEVVDDAIAQLDETQIDDIRRRPSPTRMHFGLGLWIRNNYIHSGRMGTVSSPDSLSWTVTEEIARKLLPEYAPYPLAFALLDDGYGALQSATGSVSIAVLRRWSMRLVGITRRSKPQSVISGCNVNRSTAQREPSKDARASWTRRTDFTEARKPRS